MQLLIWARTYKSFGGHHPFHPIEAPVELSEAEFGSALTSIDLVLCFASPRLHATNPGAVRLFKGYNEYLSRLPERKLLRKKSELKLSVRAPFATADEVFPKSKADREALSEDFPRGWAIKILEILVSEIEDCKTKFKKTDDFDFPGFVNWLKGLHKLLPETQAQADALSAALLEKRQELAAQKSAWEVLDVDWDQFHPNARTLIPDVRLWSSIDELAPNGNDTGADALALVLKHHAHLLAEGDEGRNFYESVWRSWGFAGPPPSVSCDELERETHRELIIGLAFALLKVFGQCPVWLQIEALSQIDQYSEFVEANHSDWSLKAECLAIQSRMKAVLMSLSAP